MNTIIYVRMKLCLLLCVKILKIWLYYNTFSSIIVKHFRQILEHIMSISVSDHITHWYVVTYERTALPTAQVCALPCMTHATRSLSPDSSITPLAMAANTLIQNTISNSRYRENNTSKSLIKRLPIIK